MFRSFRTKALVCSLLAAPVWAFLLYRSAREGIVQDPEWAALEYAVAIWAWCLFTPITAAALATIWEIAFPSFPLTHEQLEDLARQNPPPPEYYGE